MRVLGLDPGLQECGLGRCVDGVVDRIALPRKDAITLTGTLCPFDLGAALDTARLAAALARSWGPFDLIVVEWQEIYANAAVREQNPNDLPPLSFMLGLVLSELRASGFAGTPLLPVLPKLWTKGIPKKQRQTNWLAAQPASTLALVDEIKPAGKRHNAIDGAHLSSWGHAYAAARSPAVLATLITRL